MREVVMQNYRNGHYDKAWWDGSCLRPYKRRTKTATRRVIEDREDGRYVYFFRVWDPNVYIDGNRYYSNLARIIDDYNDRMNEHALEFKRSKKGRRKSDASNSD